MRAIARNANKLTFANRLLRPEIMRSRHCMYMQQNRVWRGSISLNLCGI